MIDTPADDLNFTLSDELWEDMLALEGVGIASLIVWDESLIDVSLDEPVTDENRVYVDFELYLENQTLLELYGAAILPNENSDALVGLDAIGAILGELAEDGARIEGVFSDQEDTLVLSLASESNRSLLVYVTAWTESTWETLPEDEEEF